MDSVDKYICTCDNNKKRGWISGEDLGRVRVGMCVNMIKPHCTEFSNN